jgi:hypothetical protein
MVLVEWQVSYASRVVGVEDYNAAAMHAPGSCPLLAAGDLRSGGQVFRALCESVHVTAHVTVLCTIMRIRVALGLDEPAFGSQLLDDLEADGRLSLAELSLHV